MGFLTNTIWFTKGFWEYTNSGYEKASKHFNPKDLDVDLSQKAIMITGANSGIGRETAMQVAKRGATVYMLCRSKERGEQAMQEIKEKTGNQNIHLLLLDMSQPRQVYGVAKEFAESGKKLDILVNNAGCMVNERRLVEGDIEVNFATNTLAIHILTLTLLPLLSRSKKARVLTVSSGGMLTEKLIVDDLMNNKRMASHFDGTKVYAQNKRQQIVMTEHYARTFPSIFFATMHPGWCDTPAVQSSMPSFHQKMLKWLRTPEQGADTLVWLCCFKELESQPNGSFFQDRKPVAKHLPLSWTGNSLEEETELMKKLEEFYERFSQ